MSVYDDMAHDAGYRGEEALEAAMRLEQEAMTKALRCGRPALPVDARTQGEMPAMTVPRHETGEDSPPNHSEYWQREQWHQAGDEPFWAEDAKPPPATIAVHFCPACGWDDVHWGTAFWSRHYEEGEERRPGLPCLDGGGLSQAITYRPDHQREDHEP